MNYQKGNKTLDSCEDCLVSGKDKTVYIVTTPPISQPLPHSGTFPTTGSMMLMGLRIRLCEDCLMQRSL